MNEKEYYELPYGVGDRLELGQFLLSDHYEGETKTELRGQIYEPQTQEEIFASMLFTLAHSVVWK